ncbi:MAG: hypothetical protein A2784_00090 [Candidatus Chisholmbacteria bacterium RIFCSPHIGHO2_01_FULL_48_12]|uniref:Polysaccharide biosynthesis protein C-terminal domain-containing protein n=1 Tax=Candidatus Chisholmbacteria bacterium RIFCSPHIGHO2_01_FULL_48_12 TaxID=1797589 RepID=A0A1G1VV12_9BACT|nr:MAG: hypothetical protein A2784_00090 [Candidatus Chisholmbacteria bacterium RIFCSPHIGHO2_01_FULL_48_12]
MKLVKFLKDTFLTVGANVIYGLLIIWFFVLASRYLGPEQFGLLSLILAVYTIGFDVFTLGTSQALIRFVSVYLGKNQLKEAHSYARLIWRFRLTESVFILLAAFLVGPVFAGFYHQPLLSLPTGLAFAGVSTVLIADYFISLLRAHDQFATAAFLTTANAGFKIVFIGLVILVSPSPSLVLITLAFIASPAAVGILGLFLSPQVKPVSIPPQVKTDIIHFSKWLAVWGMAASLASRIDIILLGKLSSTYQTGIYSAALKVASGFTLIGAALSTVLTPKISRLAHQPEELKRKFIQITQLAGVLIIGMIVLAVLSAWFIPWLFGLEYLAAIPIFRILTLAAIFFIAALPANVSLISLGLSKWIGLSSLLQLAIVSLVGVLLIPRLGGQGAAWAVTASYAAVLTLANFYAVKKIFI